MASVSFFSQDDDMAAITSLLVHQQVKGPLERLARTTTRMSESGTSSAPQNEQAAKVLQNTIQTIDETLSEQPDQSPSPSV